MKKTLIRIFNFVKPFLIFNSIILLVIIAVFIALLPAMLSTICNNSNFLWLYAAVIYGVFYGHYLKTKDYL